MNNIKEFFLNNSIELYVMGAMFIAYIVQRYKNRFKELSRMERFFSSFMCSLFTIVFALPAIEVIPDLPKSAVLIIGAVCGSLGYEGIKDLLEFFLHKFTGFDADNPDVKSDRDTPVDTSLKTFMKVRAEERLYKRGHKFNEPPMPELRNNKDDGHIR